MKDMPVLSILNLYVRGPQHKTLQIKSFLQLCSVNIISVSFVERYISPCMYMKGRRKFLTMFRLPPTGSVLSERISYSEEPLAFIKSKCLLPLTIEPILSQINPVHTFIPYFLKFNITQPVPVFQRFLPFRSFNQNSGNISHSLYMLHALSTHMP
jgi:hypothetical protein